jgi:hypothetical protein
MKTVYISNRGDDKNDGAIDNPVYSWKRAKEIQGGNNEIPMRFLDRASAIRCKKEPRGNRAECATFTSPTPDGALRQKPPTKIWEHQKNRRQ